MRERERKREREREARETNVYASKVTSNCSCNTSKVPVELSKAPPVSLP